jgi:hypothetical protein
MQISARSAKKDGHNSMNHGYNLYSPARDDAEQITVTGIMVNRYGIKKGAIATKCGVSMEKKNNCSVHRLFGLDSKVFQIFKQSLVPGGPGLQVPIHVGVGRDSARVGKCMVK